MSQWTHINAVIRFDALRMIGQCLPDLGKTCSFYSSKKEEENCSVPCGSEGSMQYQVYTNPHESSIAAYTVMFWGDLRDYDNAEEILKYFQKITDGQTIRSGLLEIQSTDEFIYQYANDKWNKLIKEKSND